MKLNKLIYSFVVVSIIAPVAIGSFNPSTVKASTKGHAVSKEIAVKYSYKVIKKVSKNGYPSMSMFKQFTHDIKKEKGYTSLSYLWANQSKLDFKVIKYSKAVHVIVNAKVRYENNSNYKQASSLYYKQNGIKRNYTFHE